MTTRDTKEQEDQQKPASVDKYLLIDQVHHECTKSKDEVLHNVLRDVFRPVFSDILHFLRCLAISCNIPLCPMCVLLTL